MEVIRNLLDKNNLKNTPVIIDSIQFIDIDGDNIDEKIIYATNFYTNNHLINHKIHGYYSNYDIDYIADENTLNTSENIGFYKISLLIKDNCTYIIDEIYNNIYEYNLFEISDFREI